MKLTKLVSGLTLSAFAFFVSASMAMAQVPLFEQTLITGIVYGSDGNPVNGGDVTIRCGTGSINAPIQSNGTYSIFFPQTECKAGDTANVHAFTAGGEGTNSAPIEDTTVDGPVINLDVAIINVNISVPEFGALTGLVSMIGAAASFVYLKSKEMIG